jgi:hypothetical protein
MHGGAVCGMRVPACLPACLWEMEKVVNDIRLRPIFATFFWSSCDCRGWLALGWLCLALDP